MTAQAVAKEMIRWGRGGSIVMIGSMRYDPIKTCGRVDCADDVLQWNSGEQGMSSIQRAVLHVLA